MAVHPVNSTTKEVRKYLLALESNAISEQDAFSALTTIIKGCKKEEKTFVHLQLLLHLPFDELEKIRDDPGDFVYLSPASLMFKGISPDLYCRLIVQGELIHHFMQMVNVLQQMKFVQELITSVLTHFWDSEAPHQDVNPYMLFILARICRQEPETQTFFFDQFNNFLEQILNEKHIPQYEKLHLMIRLVGVSCMQSSDYKGYGSDLAELIEEWNFDLTNRVAKQTKDYVFELFKKPKEDEIVPHHHHTIKVLKALNAALNQFPITEDEEKQWMQKPKTHRMNWLQFIGVHAYLTKTLLEKYSSSLEGEYLVDLKAHATKWAPYKPKLTREDFQGEIEDFDHFYKVMKRFGDKERDRMVLLPTFLQFSYAEVFGKKEGLRIAEKYIVTGADFEAALGYIQKALDFEAMPSSMRGIIPEMVRFIILKILCSNPEVKQRREELVTEIFKDGVHSDLALNDFTMNLNQICTKVGFIEKESKNLEHNEDLIYSICLQNPIVAVENLMKQAIRSEQFKVLQIAKPFLLLPTGLKTAPNVINLCLEKFIDTFDELDPFFDSLITGVRNMVSNDLISSTKCYQSLQKKITDLFVGNTVNLEKVVKLLSMIEAILDSYMSLSKELDLELLHEMFRFTMHITTVAYSFTNQKTYKQMILIRKNCLKIQNKITKEESTFFDLQRDEHKVSEELSKMSLLDIGFLYIREVSVREQVKLLFLVNNSSQMDLSYSMFQEHLLKWVLNSDSDDEWPAILEFVFNVLLSSSLSLLKGMKPVEIVNDSVYAAYHCFNSINSPLLIRMYLKFYKKSVQHLWANDKLMDSNDQKTIVKTIIGLILNMNEHMKRKKTYSEKSVIETSLQQVFLILLEELNMIIAKNTEFETELKEDMLDLVCLVPVIPGKCEPIRKCVIDRVLKHEDSRMLPLTKLETLLINDDENLKEILNFSQRNEIIGLDCKDQKNSTFPELLVPQI